jgi:hypothetical protein
MNMSWGRPKKQVEVEAEVVPPKEVMYQIADGRVIIPAQQIYHRFVSFYNQHRGPLQRKEEPQIKIINTDLELFNETKQAQFSTGKKRTRTKPKFLLQKPRFIEEQQIPYYSSSELVDEEDGKKIYMSLERNDKHLWDYEFCNTTIVTDKE